MVEVQVGATVAYSAFAVVVANGLEWLLLIISGPS